MQKKTGRNASHVAIIMDGNGRWAAQRGLPRLVGHQAGARRLREIATACPDYGVTHLTVFAFSTENWKRTQIEVAGLMALFRRYIIKELASAVRNGVCVRFIGDRIRLDKRLQSLMNEIEEKTKDCKTLNITVALNYGGRDEVARAASRLSYEVERGNIAPKDVDETTLASFLDTFFLPDPDLVIRTSGEVRFSNFLLWQSAYSEYEFVDTFWPDFTAKAFGEILNKFRCRERRFGGLSA